MREFKFRYYEPSIRAMLTPSCVGEWGFYAEDIDFENGRSLPFDRLMQYTGLKDKNGKEIYESDIVRCIDHPTNIENTTSQVIFNDGAFTVQSNLTMTLISYGERWIEVIGNIYENPELLKK